jgi:hypothetical protein
MSFTTEELTTWVGSLGLPEDEKKTMLTSLGKPEVLAKVGDSILMQQDYSRKQDELVKEKARLETDLQKKQADVESFRGELTGWKTRNETKFNEAVAAREKAEAALAAHNGEVKKIAEEYGIPEDRVKSLMTVTPDPNSPPRREDRQRDEDGRYVKTDDFAKAAADVVKVPAILMAIQAEHQQLFGSGGPQLDLLKVVEDAQKNKMSLRQQWESEFKVPEQRTRVADERRNQDLENARKEGAEAERSRILAENPSAASNVRSINAPGSPILDLARKQNSERAKEAAKGPIEVDEGRGVAAAVAAYNRGTYDQGIRKQG